ncbi:MAG TPA: enoyl-CoA hydratase/isomerase family protein, partial [Clostridia bacterium]
MIYLKEYEYLNVEKHNGYALLTITRKPANALTIKTALDIAEIVDELGKDDEIRVIIITGGIQFSFFVGSDLDEIYNIMKMPGDVGTNMVNASKPVQDAFNAIEKCPKVTIAAINGIVVGLGVELALACDIRIVSELAWFKMAQVTIGIIPGAGGTQRLPKIVGLGNAKEL